MVYMWKRKIPLILITLAAGIISIIVSFSITPKFKSTVVLFPASASPVSKSLLQTNYQDRVGMLGFGEEEQLERILQVLHSDDIRDHIIEEFNLMEHYEIDIRGAFPLTKLFAQYATNIKFNRTEFNSIVIEVMDEDPQMAADLANSIAAQIDVTMNEMKRDRATKAFKLVEAQYLSAAARVQELNDSVSYYNKKGVIAHEDQIGRLTEAYGHAVTSGNKKAAIELEEKIQELEKYTAPFLQFHALWENETFRLSDLTAKYIEAKAETDLSLSHVFVLDRAYKAEKKAYPKKSIIVIASTFSAFILALILFIFFESFLRRIRSEQ
ncbi:Wzz/FepE/Etk N-terminal domain-containing protein [Bacteroidota bacterium]